MKQFGLLRHATQFWIGLISLIVLLLMACGGGESPTAIISDTNTRDIISETDAIAATMQAFSAFFASDLPKLSNPALLALFSPAFMDNGQGISAFLSQISKQAIGFKFADIVVDMIDTETARVYFTLVNGAGMTVANGHKGGVVHWQMKRNAATGIGQINGNQRLANGNYGINIFDQYGGKISAYYN